MIFDLYNALCSYHPKSNHLLNILKDLLLKKTEKKTTEKWRYNRVTAGNDGSWNNHVLVANNCYTVSFGRKLKTVTWSKYPWIANFMIFTERFFFVFCFFLPYTIHLLLSIGDYKNIFSILNPILYSSICVSLARPVSTQVISPFAGGLLDNWGSMSLTPLVST